MPTPAPRSPQGYPAEVLGVALRLGLTSFGGPIAHLGYFERVYVRERAWLSAEQYAALVGLCQILSAGWRQEMHGNHAGTERGVRGRQARTVVVGGIGLLEDEDRVD